MIDTHAHYDDEQFKEIYVPIFKQLRESNVVKVINSAADINSLDETMELTRTYDFMYGLLGIHPECVHKMTEETIEKIKTLASERKVVGIGEIGLDYHYDKDKKEQQAYWFRRQIQLAKELKLPICVHSREAAADTLTIMKEENAAAVTGVIHCYSYGIEMAKEYLDMGFSFGIGGVLTFKNAKKLVEVVQMLPMERIVLETDCPYLSPEPYRGQRNDSSKMIYVMDKIAQIKGITTEEVNRITSENAERIYTKLK